MEDTTAQPEQKPEPARTYTVKRGDTLWGIARETLGGGVKWPAIYALNRDQISYPRYIYPGTVLRLPAA